MPDSYSDPFFQTKDLTLDGPLFTESTETAEAKSGQGKLSVMGLPFHISLFKRNLQNRTFSKIF